MSYRITLKTCSWQGRDRKSDECQLDVPRSQFQTQTVVNPEKWSVLMIIIKALKEHIIFELLIKFNQ